MNDQEQVDALARWNERSRTNTENAMVSSMFESGAQIAELVEQFSTWLLVGAAAIAAFFITNGERLVPFFGSMGFYRCGVLLCLSCLAGFVAKTYAIRNKINSHIRSSVQETFLLHLKKHEEDEKELNEAAEQLGLTIETGVRMDRVLKEFYSLLPMPVKWWTERSLNKNKGNPQIAYISAVKLVNRLGVATLIQSIFFFLFLLAGLGYASAT